MANNLMDRLDALIRKLEDQLEYFQQMKESYYKHSIGGDPEERKTMEKFIDEANDKPNLSRHEI